MGTENEEIISLAYLLQEGDAAPEERGFGRVRETETQRHRDGETERKWDEGIELPKQASSDIFSSQDCTS